MGNAKDLIKFSNYINSFIEKYLLDNAPKLHKNITAPEGSML